MISDPFGPALNIALGCVCAACGHDELSRCTLGNPHHRIFRDVPPEEWEPLRRSFARAAKANRATLVAPGPSVREHYLRFLPDPEPHFQMISHGMRPVSEAALTLHFQSGNRLRDNVLGHLAPHKGLDLLRAMMDGLLRFADLHPLGGGERGGNARPGLFDHPARVPQEGAAGSAAIHRAACRPSPFRYAGNLQLHASGIVRPGHPPTGHAHRQFRGPDPGRRDGLPCGSFGAIGSGVPAVAGRAQRRTWHRAPSASQTAPPRREGYAGALRGGSATALAFGHCRFRADRVAIRRRSGPHQDQARGRAQGAESSRA